MTQHTLRHTTIEEWIKETVPFALADPASCDAAIDTMVTGLGDAVEVLGIGEALHGGEELLILRNRLFQRLVEAHGYSVIAIESSFPLGRATDAYVAGDGPDDYAAIREGGFSHGFGHLEANRELVGWMRVYNADPAHATKLRFYGFDQPSAGFAPVSPRHLLDRVLDYLAPLDDAAAEYRDRLAPLLGQDADWQNPLAWRDPANAPALLANASALRLAIEDLIAALRVRRPALVAASDAARFREAAHDATQVRELLNFFVALAGDDGFSASLGVRDATMADNLTAIAEAERGGGKVLAFAHNSHLQRGMAQITVGGNVYRWWPAGAQLDALLGPRYAVIGTAVGVSEANGISQPEDSTLEARLLATPGPARLIPTHRGAGLPPDALAALPLRSREAANPSYVAALGPQSLTDFDWLAVFDTVAYNRGGPPLHP